MLESLDGFKVSSTRQNAGRSRRACPSGGVKGPAGTDFAAVIVAAASVSLDKSSQGVAAKAGSTATINNTSMSFMMFSRSWTVYAHAGPWSKLLLSPLPTETHRRPDPERLLQQVMSQERQTERERLKVFLGYASGLGKSMRLYDDASRPQESGP